LPLPLANATLPRNAQVNQAEGNGLPLAGDVAYRHRRDCGKRVGCSFRPVRGAGVGRVWRIVLSRIASMLPVLLAVTTSGSPFLSGDVLISSLAFSGLWIILLLFLERRRGRKAIPD